MIPFYQSFGRPVFLGSFIQRVEFAIDLMFLADIFLMLRTSFLDKWGSECFIPKEIALAYSSQKGFYIDLLSILAIFTPFHRFFSYFSLLKVVRILRLKGLINRMNVTD
jgi:hypothetical protein